MRALSQIDNLAKAACLSGMVTFMSVPRILTTNLPWVYIPFSFFVGILICAAVTAWSYTDGLNGLLRSPRETLAATAVVLVIVALALPFQIYVLDPHYRGLLEEAGGGSNLLAQFPQTIMEWVGLALWSAGFQILFFVAAPICYFARLTHRLWLAVALTVLFHLYVMSRQCGTYGLNGSITLLLFFTLITGMISCVFFVRAGLIPVMLLTVGLKIHLLWQL